MTSSERVLTGSSAPLVALFGGHKEEHRIDLVVYVLAGTVTVLVWAAGVIFIAGRLLLFHERLSSGSRLAAGIAATVAWTVGVVLLAMWVVS